MFSVAVRRKARLSVERDSGVFAIDSRAFRGGAVAETVQRALASGGDSLDSGCFGIHTGDELGGRRGAGRSAIVDEAL